MNRSLLAFGASAVLLLGFLLVLDPAALAAQLAGTDSGWFALGFILVCLALVCWSEALRPLLADAGGPVSAWRGALAFSASMGARQLVPVGALGGPAITAYVVERESDLPYQETLAVVTVAEFMSTVASLVLAGIGILALTTAGDVGRPLRLFALVLVAVAGALGALALAFWYRRRAVRRTVLGVARALETVAGGVSSRLRAALARDRASVGLDRFYSTVDHVAGNRRSLGVSYAYHQLGWVCVALPLYTSAVALDVRLPLALVAFVVPASLLVDVLPLPGGLGGIELALVGMLVALGGVDAVRAGAVVVLYRLCSYWFLVLVGGLAAVYSTVSVRELLAEEPGR